MGTGNFDASRVAQRNRSTVMYGFYANNNAAVNAGTSVRREQPGTQLQELVAYRNMTKGFFTPVVNGVAGCECSQDVVVNGGGNNGNNVQ